MKQITIFGVATPYAFEIIETCNRLGLPFVAVDNLGTSDVRLKGSLVEILDFSIPAIVAPSKPKERAMAVEAGIEMGLNSFTSLIDPTAVTASSMTIGCGTYINAMVTVGANAKIGCHVNLNRSSSVAHDCSVENYASIAPGAILCGSSVVGLGTLVGAGSVILPEVRVGNNCIVGAGAIVTKDLPDNSVAVGNPARVIRQNSEAPILLGCASC